MNREYVAQERLRVGLLGPGHAWLDTGSHDSLLEASEFIATIEKRQGLKAACIAEIAYRLGYIDRAAILKTAEFLKKNGHGDCLLRPLN